MLSICGLRKGTGFLSSGAQGPIKAGFGSAPARSRAPDDADDPLPCRATPFQKNPYSSNYVLKQRQSGPRFGLICLRNGTPGAPQDHGFFRTFANTFPQPLVSPSGTCGSEMALVVKSRKIFGKSPAPMASDLFWHWEAPATWPRCRTRRRGSCIWLQSDFRARCHGGCFYSAFPRQNNHNPAAKYG